MVGLNSFRKMEITNKYKWTLGNQKKKGLSAEEAAIELNRIKDNNNGLLTSEIVLEAARDKKSKLHVWFDWDDSIAAERWRVEQAKLLLRSIKVEVISNGESKEVRVYEVVSKNEGSGEFKNINDLNEKDIHYIRQQALINLKSWREKLSVYQDFKFTVMHIGNAISELEQTRVNG